MSETVPVVPPDAPSAAGVTDPALRALLHEHWEHVLRRSPFFATELGDHRFDDQVADRSLEALERDRVARADFIRRGRALAADALSDADRLTLEIWLWDLESDQRLEVCQFQKWSFGPTNNPVTEFQYLPESHSIETPEDFRNLIARYRAAAGYVDREIASLRVGLAEGRVATAHTTRLTIEMVTKQLEQETDDWPMLAPARSPRPWDPAVREELGAEMRAVVIDQVRPAFARYRDFLRDEVLPGARPDERSGVRWLPDGDACYSAAIVRHTSLPRDAATLHDTGLAELDRIQGAMRDLGERLFGTRDLAVIFERLRTDPALYFDSERAVADKASEALARARAAVPDWFGLLPRTECVVRQIPDYEAPYTYVAYYRPPHADGSKPGEYYVNTYKPNTRPRYEAEVLAFHESIPGHHLQVSLAQELKQLPAFRRHMDATAYVEGWALYTESLADEMGLYSADIDRLGMLSFDSWRAARLVVDTGIHAKGWNRDQAVAFMLANTPLAENNIRNEVDRYVNWPGQALGYKTGQLELSKMRARAETRLKGEFDIRAFHDVVLESGAVPLPVLERRVDAWIEARAG